MIERNHSDVMEPLKGKDLLEAIKNNPEASKEQLLSLCGYFNTREDGTKSFSPTVMGLFYQAVIEAQGLDLDVLKKPSPSGRSGRSLPYTATCMKNGQVLLGSGYLKAGGYKPGDTFRVETRDGAMRLVPVNS